MNQNHPLFRICGAVGVKIFRTSHVNCPQGLDPLLAELPGRGQDGVRLQRRVLGGLAPPAADEGARLSLLDRGVRQHRQHYRDVRQFFFLLSTAFLRTTKPCIRGETMFYMWDKPQLASLV